MAAETTDPFEQSNLGDSRVQPTTVQAWLEFAQIASDGYSSDAVNDPASTGQGPGTVIKGLDKVPVTHITLEFPLTGVPTANFILAVGYNATTGSLAAVQSLLQNFDTQLRVRCYVLLTGKESFDRNWPSTPMRIWDGVTIGPGYTRSRDNTSLVINSAHWLSELDASSVFSANFQRSSADNFLAVYGVETGDSGNMAASVSSLTTIANQSIADGSTGLPGDMWQNVTLPMLKLLMQTSDMASPEGAGVQTSNLGQAWELSVGKLITTCQTAAINADNTPGEIPTLGNQRAYGILSTRFNQAKQIISGNLVMPNATQYSTAVCDSASAVMLSQMGSQGCLDKILTIGSMFMFKMVANVESASMVPHMSVLNQAMVWRNVFASDYTEVSGQGYTPRRLQGVGLTGTSTFSLSGNSATQGMLIGSFRRYNNGQWLFAKAPPWLYYQQPPEYTTGLRTSMSLKAGNAPASPTAEEAAAEGAELGCRLAQAIYYEEAFKNRAAELTGRLRFDIAPGSMVRVFTANTQLPQFGGPIYANVSSVKIVIDASDPSASTTLGLSHLREAQDGNDWASSTHPIYTSTPAWVGSPLVVIDSSDLQPLSVGT